MLFSVLALASALHTAPVAPTTPNDTVVVSVIDRRRPDGSRDPLPDLVAILRARVPDRPVIGSREGLTYEADSGVLLLQVFVDEYGTSFNTGFRNQWRGAVIGRLRIVDTRGATPRGTVLPVQHEARRSNIWGNRSGKQAMSDAFDAFAGDLAGFASGTTPFTSDALTLKAASTDYEPYRGTGTASIAGQAFLMTRAGDAKKAAGRDVTVDPYTPLARDWYRTFGTDMQALTITPAEPAFSLTRRSVVADADGRFTISNLPQGTYLVRTVVTWEAPVQTDPLQGGVVSEIITVGSGERKDVILRAAVPAK